MSIVSIVACFVVVFLVGCTIAMVAVVLNAEDADGKYYDVDELCILDDIMEGDDD